MFTMSKTTVPLPPWSAVAETMLTERSAGPLGATYVGVVGFTGVGCFVAGPIATVALPCACDTPAVFGRKMIVRGSLMVVVVPESVGNTAIELVPAMKAAPHGIFLPSAVSKVSELLHGYKKA